MTYKKRNNIYKKKTQNIQQLDYDMSHVVLTTYDFLLFKANNGSSRKGPISGRSFTHSTFNISNELLHVVHIWNSHNSPLQYNVTYCKWHRNCNPICIFVIFLMFYNKKKRSIILVVLAIDSWPFVKATILFFLSVNIYIFPFFYLKNIYFSVVLIWFVDG